MSDYGTDFDEMEDMKPPKMKDSWIHEDGVLNPGLLIFDKFGSEMWAICDLDDSHYIKLKNMKEHLIECKKQILKSSRKTECPFNPLHIINRMEIANHIFTCPNRVVLTNTLCDFEPKRQTIDGVKMEPINVLPNIEDTWDKDENPDAGYDPVDSTKFRMVLQPTPPRLSKAQKKAYREAQREKFKQLGGVTKEKPRAAPYTTNRNEINSLKGLNKGKSQTDDTSVEYQSLINSLSGTVIADPREAALRKINDRLKIVQMLENRLNEEKLELQRQIEAYRTANIKIEDTPVVNADPRLAPRKSIDNLDLCNASIDHSSRILPDAMFSPMIR